MAIGHVRYSTTGANAWENAQPFTLGGDARLAARLALAHNGNLTTPWSCTTSSRRGVAFSSTSDTEIIAALIATQPADIWRTRSRRCCRGCRARSDGRDERRTAWWRSATRTGSARSRSGGSEPDGAPAGCGPVAGYCVASESCAFDIIGAEFLREVQPGEIVTLSRAGCASIQVVADARKAFCVFEYIYFARPDTR